MILKKYSWIFCLLILLNSCYKEVFLPENANPGYDYIFYFNDIPVAFDKTRKLILCPIDAQNLDVWEVHFSSNGIEVIEIDGTSVADDKRYTFRDIRDKRSFRISLRLPDGSTDQYTLEFTTLPVFQIFTENQIPDEPEVLAWIIISSGVGYEKVMTSYIGIERRGGTAYNRPKKSYKIEFWVDEYESEHKDVSFFGLIPDDDWVLDAMYIDKARIRNILSFDICFL